MQSQQPCRAGSAADAPGGRSSDDRWHAASAPVSCSPSLRPDPRGRPPRPGPARMAAASVCFPVSPSTAWPAGSLDRARSLHDLLRLSDRDWHALKSDRRRRGAELLAAALTQLLSGGDPQDVTALVDQAGGWLRGELKDPGCPDHGVRRNGAARRAEAGSPAGSSAHHQSSDG
ncbi:DUF6439 family protein [Synechococcus sp. RSCCF101]|uniref:DUF6439 family protein n=1 Tax=Synechococcus sp. RSCCF101 TaxID=2511069 RepID=UPI00351A0E81